MGWWRDILCAMSSDVVARHFVNHEGELLISCVRRRRSKLRGCIVLQLLHPFIQMAMLHVPDIDLYIIWGKWLLSMRGLFLILTPILRKRFLLSNNEVKILLTRWFCLARWLIREEPFNGPSEKT